VDDITLVRSMVHTSQSRYSPGDSFNERRDGLDFSKLWSIIGGVLLPQAEVSIRVNFLIDCFSRWKLGSGNSALYKFNRGFNCWTSMH